MSSNNAGPHARQGGGGGALFTDEMRDRQARGKDPYIRPEQEEDDDYDREGEDGGRRRRLRLGHGPQADSFEDRERRGYAMSVLDSPDQLMMYAQSTGDSVPGQRLRFMTMLCGFNPPLPSSAQQQQQQQEGKKGSSSRRDTQGGRTGERAGR